jgi:hypothetical protein
MRKLKKLLAMLILDDVKKINKFSQKSIEKLKYYIYALRDPSNNEVFYIGKCYSFFNHTFFIKYKQVIKKFIDTKSFNGFHCSFIYFHYSSPCK